VIQFFSQMLKFPVAAVAAGFEIMARVMRDMQQTFDRNVDVVAEGMAQSLREQTAETGTQVQDPEGTSKVVTGNRIDESDSTTQKAGGNMGDWDGQDQDLSGEDLKVVQYRIIFTKRDYEATLSEHEETVNYPTNGASYGGLKVAQFMGDLREHGRKLPQSWQDNDEELKYPPDKFIKDGRYYGIPEDDQRYITFLYEVIRHVEREEKEYDKEQVKILDQIRRRL
jgi:hypothetical protein